MKGLLLKDYYTLTKQLKIFFLMILVFACLPGLSVSAFGVVYAAMLPITALAYDERSKWDSLAVMMPYTAKSIVLSKYILGYIGVLLAGVLSVVASIGFSLVKHTAIEPESLISVILVVCAAVVLQSINLPLMFKLGVEKGRIALFLLIGASTALGTLFSGNISDMFSSANVGMGLILTAAFILSVVINAFSVAVSTVIYKRKVK